MSFVSSKPDPYPTPVDVVVYLISAIMNRVIKRFYCMIFKLIIQNSSLGTHCEIAYRWMPHNLTNEKPTLVQVMAWCHQATSHYLSQCWPRSMSPYDITRLHWVKMLAYDRLLSTINGIFYIGKITSLYWIRAQFIMHSQYHRAASAIILT